MSLPKRRAYAITNPLNGPNDSVAPYAAVRVHARGFLLMSVLAVDR